jgi:hypothetical protein
MLKKTFIAATIFIVIYLFTKRIINKVRSRIEENNLQSDIAYSKKLSGLV